MIFGKNGLVISGHRDLADGDDLIVRKAMVEFIGYNDFDYLMFGGARGVDTLALAIALDLRETATKKPMLIVVVPDTLAAQPQETRVTSARADRVIELQHPVTPSDRFWALRHRNEFMIDWVFPLGRLLAFWNGEKSGTANAFYYARDYIEVSTRMIKGRKKEATWTPMRT